MVLSKAEMTESQSCKEATEMTYNKEEETASFLPVPANELDTPASHDIITEDSQPVNYKDYKFTKRILVDLPFRRRFLHSAFLCWAIVGMGWASGQGGPSFPDLRGIIGEDIETASWLFTVHSLGYVVGSFTEGFLYERVNTLPTLVVAILVMAVTSAVLPWCPTFAPMLVVRFMAGVGGGSLEAIAIADIASIWDEEGRPYMQTLHFSYGFGGILSPLATEPFLSKKACIQEEGNGTGIYRYDTTTEPFALSSVINATQSPGCKNVYGETRVQYAYLITCIILVSCAIPFLVIFIRNCRTQYSLKMKADKTNKKRPDTLPLTLKSILVVMLCSLLFMYAAVEDSFSNFLMTFSLQYLDWTKEQGSLASSCYWLTFTIGRFLGIIIVKWFTPGQLIGAFIIFNICSFVGLLVASITMTFAAIWLFVLLIGLSMSIICPCIYSWTEEIILEVTGMIAGLFTVACATGLVVNPVLIGYLIKGFGPISLLYLLLAQSSACLVIYVIIQIMIKYFVKPITRKSIEIEVKI